MIHGHPTSMRRFAPHTEAGSTGPAIVKTPARTTVVARPEEVALPIVRLLLAVAMIFAFGVLAPMIAAAAR